MLYLRAFLLKELKSLSRSLPCEPSGSVFISIDSSNLSRLKVLISGTEDTPYEHGLFLFDIKLPQDYPNNPPLMTIKTTGNGTVRFNPNLYHTGNVCLSIINTWDCEPEEMWNPSYSTLLQVFLSIQSLVMTQEVIQMEPCYEHYEIDSKANMEYSMIIEYANIKYAITGMIQNPPVEFTDIVRKHFAIKKEKILERENLQAKIEDYKSSASDISNNSEDIPEAAESDVVTKDEKESLRLLMQQGTPRSHTIMGSFEKWVDRVPIWKWQGKPLPDPNAKSKIRMLVITWNMNGKEPPSEIGDILRSDIHHHIYIVSVQECLRSIGTSLIISSKKRWEEKLSQTLGDEYMILKAKDLGALHLVVFVHKSIRKLINCAEVDDVTTGLGNVIANKGGICITFRLGNTKIAVIGCHLAAGFSAISKRNNDFIRIEKELSLPSYLPKHGFISDRNDCTILAGDLNYRINGPREAVELLVDERMVEPLLRSDQLIEQINSQKVPEGYQEGAILFAPTYRFDRFSSRYDSSKKQRIPAWTDRILYKQKSGILKQHSYDAIMQQSHSDHKPVFSQFSLKFENSQSHEHVAVARETSCLCNLF